MMLAQLPLVIGIMILTDWTNSHWGGGSTSSSSGGSSGGGSSSGGAGAGVALMVPPPMWRFYAGSCLLAVGNLLYSYCTLLHTVYCTHTHHSLGGQHAVLGEPGYRCPLPYSIHYTHHTLYTVYCTRRTRNQLTRSN
jgi:hypothetical protein